MFFKNLYNWKVSFRDFAKYLVFFSACILKSMYWHVLMLIAKNYKDSLASKELKYLIHTGAFFRGKTHFNGEVP